VIKRLPSFVGSEDHANFADQLNVIARNKCYMFKLFGFVSKLSLLDKYSVIYGDRTNLLPDESAELKALAHSILKRIREKDFSCLVRALEKRGGCETPCIFFQTHERLGKRVVVEPQVVLFRIFRLPQIRSLSELKHIAACSPCHDIDGKVCINPFHYSATISSGPVDAILTSFPSVMKMESGESSGFISNLTQSSTCRLDSRTLSSQSTGSVDPFVPGKPWCSIAYWELNERIGPIFEGTSDVINVFETLPEPTGFCLAELNRRNDVSEGTKRVRAQIGYGLQLTRESDGIWIYNRSDYSLFANGPTLIYTNESSPTGKLRHNVVVHKIPPGYSLKVYDYKLSSQVCRAVDSAGVRCSHPDSVRISFKKGWGATLSSKKYCRPLVTSCPCWIEVHLSVAE